MSDACWAGGAAAALDAVRALESLGVRLGWLAARVERARLAAPVCAEPDWSGPTRRLYDLGLDDLHRALASAAASIEGALAASERAAGALAAGLPAGGVPGVR